MTRLLEQVRQHLPTAAALAYLSGFLVTNVYLGSLGIVNVDVLRSRYILTGVLFLFFASIIIALVDGLVRVLGRHHELPAFQLVRKILAYSSDRLLLVFFIGFVLTTLGQAVLYQPVGLPPLAPARPWQEWVQDSLPGVARSSLVLPMVAIVVVILNRLVRGIRQRTLLAPVRQFGVRRTVVLMLMDSIVVFGVAAIFYAYAFLFGLLWTLITSLYTSTPGSSPPSVVSVFYGWGRFFLAAVLVYFLAVVYLVFMFFSVRATRDVEKGEYSDDVPQPHFLWMAGAAASLLIIPVYALAVYPSIPQHLGGGAPVPVHVEVSEEFGTQTSLRDADVYLIDRTTGGSLFLLVVQGDGKTRRVLEIPGSRIRVLEYRRTR